MKNLYKLFYIISAVLALAFVVFLIIDLCLYNPITTSAPFYAYIIIRGLEFLLPALIIFIVGEIFRKKVTQ